LGSNSLEGRRQRLFQDASHAGGLGTVEQVVGRQEAPLRIGERPAQRMRASQHAPAGAAQQVFELRGHCHRASW
jgi:hypothetical protein